MWLASLPSSPPAHFISFQPDSDSEHFLAIISDIARENDIDIVAGTVVELGSHHVPHRTADEGGLKNGKQVHDDKLFNTAYYIDRTGKIIGRYTKKVREHLRRTQTSFTNDCHPHSESMAPREDCSFTRS